MEGTLAQVLEGSARWCVLHGDCRARMAELPDNSVDAVVTDAPYHLTSASRNGSPRKNDPEKPHGRHAIGSKGFMGRTWDGGDVALDPDTWREVLRVLKPGGHLLAFGGTRTAHRLACAIEDAGFEIRDSLSWCYGSGFPKSLNVSKAIDAANGHARGTTPDARNGPNTRPTKGDKYSLGYAGQTELDGGPVTDAAREWNGWGTALKPSHEPIILARKPLEGTVAENVLKYGTGALNIDGCRVATSLGDDKSARYGHSEKESPVHVMGPQRMHAEPDGLGRWPPNLLLTHDARCRRVGAVDVPANPTWDTPNHVCKPGYSGGMRETSGLVHGDGKTETVEQWECVDGCPVRELARQSGDTPSGGVTHQPTRTGFDGGFSSGTSVHRPPDRGSAARYFPQFEWTELDDVAPFFYQAKASRAERDAGLERFRPRSASEGSEAGARNPHPTIKPVGLLRWLVRLATPPGGIVLDPFGGVLSCGLACLAEGFRYVACELLDTDEEPHVSVGRARLHHFEGHEFVPRESLRAARAPAQASLFGTKTGDVCSPVRARTEEGSP